MIMIQDPVLLTKQAHRRGYKSKNKIKEYNKQDKKKHHMKMKVIWHKVTGDPRKPAEKNIKQDLSLKLGRAFILE